MAGGWTRDGAVQDQIDATIRDEIARARSGLSGRKSLEFCQECEDAIPEARRRAVPGVRLCIACQAAHDGVAKPAAGFNRRGSKDSQLR